MHYAMLCHAVACCIMTRHVILDYDMPCYDVLCHAVLCYWQSVQTFYVCLEGLVGWMFVSVVMLRYAVL